MAGMHETYGNLAHLPPRDAWLQDPQKIKKFYAPTDDRGFVQHEATIETVLQLFDDDYVWPVDWQKNAPQILRPDDHHFHWLARMYEREHFSRSQRSELPKLFRNLPSNRGLLPRQFHNVLHNVTVPPRIPKLDFMEQYLRSYESAVQLFRHAERAIKLEEMMDNAEDPKKKNAYVEKYDTVFEGYSEQLKLALGLDAFKMIGLEDEFDTSSFTETMQRLGSCALYNIPNYTDIYFIQQAAPSNNDTTLAA